MDINPISRRHFVVSAGIALTAAHATRAIGANDRVRVGIVGLGGRGKDHMDLYMAAPGAEIAALCDVNQAALETLQSPGRWLRHRPNPLPRR
jgi:hypothetical protein